MSVREGSKRRVSYASDPTGGYAIYIGADDFREVSHMLCKQIADSFAGLAKRLGLAGQGRFHVKLDDLRLPEFVPQVVVSALSSELYFKCLHQIEFGRYPNREHALDVLFNTLPPDRQERIICHWLVDLYQKPAPLKAPLPASVNRKKPLTQDLREGFEDFQQGV